jgi:predicted nuclease of predicted toxin-antitoxin system
MRLYLDENIASRKLVALLLKAGHEVTTVAEVGMIGKSDPKQLTFTIQQNYVLLTRNDEDFGELHELVRTSGGGHPGILTVCSDNDPKRDMKPPDIVRAIAKLEAAGVPIVNELHILNHWR